MASKFHPSSAKAAKADKVEPRFPDKKFPPKKK